MRLGIINFYSCVTNCMPLLVDSHCHIHFNAYKDDYADIARSAVAEDVWMITIGTQKDTSKNGIDVAHEIGEGLWCTIGLHPNHLFSVYIDEDEHPFMTREEDFDYDYYKQLGQSSDKVVAIGECGLDYYRMPEARNEHEIKEKQERVFRQHLDLCEELNLPAVLHIRDAHDETLVILKEYVDAGKLQRKGVVHCFTSGAEHAKQYVALGFMVSFTGIITFPAKKKSPYEQEALWDAVRAVPLEMLMVETDAPYLTPIPHRGERNVPQHVKFVAEKVAELKEVSFEEVAEQTTNNAIRLFGLT